jgi:C_GCAxxG_C_C family probable redox protein
MNDIRQTVWSRRKFMRTVPGWLIATGVMAGPIPSIGNQKTLELPEELTAEERERVAKSFMAKDISNYFGEGYSCAESLFMVSLRFLKKPEELVWISSGFGGGMYHRDLCGFLTAGIMALGLSTGMIDAERKEAKAKCSQLVKEYWKWWTSEAPLRCADIRTEGTTSKLCKRLGLLAAAKTEELIKSIGT